MPTVARPVMQCHGMLKLVEDETLWGSACETLHNHMMSMAYVNCTDEQVCRDCCRERCSGSGSSRQGACYLIPRCSESCLVSGTWCAGPLGCIDPAQSDHARREQVLNVERAHLDVPPSREAMDFPAVDSAAMVT